VRHGGGGEALPDLLHDGVGLRELAGGALGVDFLAVEPDLEDPTRTRLQDQAVELVLVLLGNRLRQTDGFGQIASSRAVFDLELHGASS
jgi:hypothetical protein